MRKKHLNVNTILLMFMIFAINPVFSQEITMYTMNGCARCASAKDYFNKNGIKYKEYSTENDADNNRMWSVLWNAGLGNGESVTMPVIIVDGKVNYSIPNLSTFLSQIGQKNQVPDVNNNKSNSSNKLVVYTMKGCGRCAYAVDYLKKNNIVYTEYSTSNKTYSNEMWQYVQTSGKYEGGAVTMPVIVNNGQIDFNIPDIQDFMSKIGSTATNSQNEVNLPSNNQNTVSSGNLTQAQQDEFIRVHNKYRAEVGSAPLTWNEDLAKYALAWGNHLASIGCDMEHRPYSGEWAQKYGENLYWCSGKTGTPTDAVTGWGNEKKDYNGKVISNATMVAGHYTQMIWSNTTQVGCAIVKCDGNQYIIVCNYNPPGNYVGESPYKK